MERIYITYRSLGARWAVTSSWRPFSLLTLSFGPFGRSGRYVGPVKVRPATFGIFKIFGIFGFFGFFGILDSFGIFGVFRILRSLGIFGIFRISIVGVVVVGINGGSRYRKWVRPVRWNGEQKT